MENTKKVRFTLFVLILLSLPALADISVSLNTEKDGYSPGDEVEFNAVVELTECEEMDDADLDINDGVHLSCSLPKHYGYYPGYGNCNLDVAVEESNPEDCYAYGGGNTVYYTILWNLPDDCVNEGYYAELIVSYDGDTYTGATGFEVACTITTTTSSTTTTIKKRRGGGNGGYPPKEPKIKYACKDGVKNYGETDVDCGGPCPPCKDGENCLKNSDCESEFCHNKVCKTPSCSDGVMNQDETDVDCGGPCIPCKDGETCVLDIDCLSEICYKGECKPPSCRDNVLNQDETDVDCGGSCKSCREGRRCVKDSDCLNNYCHAHTCMIPPCTDGVMNQDETDVDCGGPCSPCREGQGCVKDSDCLSGFCYNESCRIPSCTDGIRNQGEEGIDCGGPCSPCVPGIVGSIIAFSGSPGGLLLMLVIVILLILLLLHLRGKKKYVVAADYLKDLKGDELKELIDERKPHIVAGTSRKLRRLKGFIDEGGVRIVWIQDWDLVNELVSKGIDDNNAESIALAKQLKAGLYIKDPEAKRIAEEAGVKVYDN